MSAASPHSPDGDDRLIEGWRGRVERTLASWLEPGPATRDEVLAQAMRYAVFNGGKRLRPLLVHAAGRALAIDAGMLDAPAGAVELIHCYSLSHDDLPAMDDDDLRRGRPTLHLAFDEATAILAGDALQALAFERLARDPALAGQPAAAVAMMGELAAACGATGMAGGQALDLQFEGHTPEQAALEDMFRRKTGALIHAAVMMPAALRPDLPAEQHQALSQFAGAIGLAFQIRDDLLEIEGDTESIGKPSDSDATRRKASWPHLFGREAAADRIEELAGRAANRLALVDGDTAGLQQLAERLLNRRA